jgi:deoxyadenosine/deoxycytidine kinase
MATTLLDDVTHALVGIPQKTGETPPVGRCVKVAGRIGTGKSTLVRSAMAAGLIGSVEHINKLLLADYVADPKTFAFTLQMAAMHAACVRQDLAESVGRQLSRTIVIERAPQENIIFAVANRDAGFMSTDQFRAYMKYIRLELAWDREMLKGMHNCNVFPWAPENETIRRMIERGEMSEQAYTDTYLECLAHAYFRAVLESNLAESASLPYRVEPFIVIDWTNYGDWSTVERFLNMNPKIFEGTQQQNSAEHVTLSSPEENAEYQRILFVEDMHPESCEHPFWTERDPIHVLHMDLFAYETASKKTHKHIRVAFRDAFFRALSAAMPVVMHGTKRNARTCREYRHVYPLTLTESDD